MSKRKDLGYFSRRRITLTALCASLASAAPVSPASAEPVLALTTDNRLVAFDSDRPDRTLATVTVTGLQAGETLVGVDFRPANGGLYAVSSASRLYVIPALASGVATQIGQTLAPALDGTNFGMDFNPVPDRVRIVSDTGQNLRVNPDTGQTTSDAALDFDAGDRNGAETPRVSAVAYTNNYVGATVATIFGIDAELNALTRVGSPQGSPVSPNTGLLFTLGSIGVDTSSDVGADVSAASGSMYVSVTRPGRPSSELFEVSLGEGFPVNRIGAIAAPTVIRGIALPMPDLTAPTLSVTVPPRGRVRTTRSTATVSGTAADDLLLKSVEYKVDPTEDWKPATGTTAWTFELSRLRVGRTTVRVRTTDLTGNESAISTVTVDRVARRRRSVRR